MNGAALLVAALRDPQTVLGHGAAGWNALIAAARAELLIGTLAHRLDGLAIPAPAARIMADARASAESGRIAALWEAEMARRALAPLGVPVVLLKGTAFVAAGLKAGQGRHIGDLDILVPREALADVEKALFDAGWEWVKPDPYDDAYYRQWMHELPPMIHRTRDRMIDVQHTILPLTARIMPDAAAILADAEPLPGGLGGGLAVPHRNDMICHGAAHLLADGDLAGGLRNLWDIHCLVDERGTEGLATRAAHHGLSSAVARAMRLADALYGVEGQAAPLDRFDRLVLRRLIARDGWGRPTRKGLRFAFYLRGHGLRMPPAMLARHLWTKWRRGHRPV